jgi:hypothetical protein
METVILEYATLGKTHTRTEIKPPMIVLQIDKQMGNNYLGIILADRGCSMYSGYRIGIARFG